MFQYESAYCGVFQCTCYLQMQLLLQLSHDCVYTCDVAAAG